MFRKLKDDEVETIIEFANNNMDVSKTARDMFTHRNTVVYRLKKIGRETGLNPYRFYDLFQLLQLAGVVTIQCKNFKKQEGEHNEQTTEL